MGRPPRHRAWLEQEFKSNTSAPAAAPSPVVTASVRFNFIFYFVKSQAGAAFALMVSACNLAEANAFQGKFH